MRSGRTRILGLYLDTNVWSFYFADDAPEKRDVTVAFLSGLPDSLYEVYISSVVLNEIADAPVEM